MALRFSGVNFVSLNFTDYVSMALCRIVNGRLLHDTAQMAHLSCVGQKAMDDVIRQNVEQETENSVNDVSAFISKNKMNDDF